jgi:D-inositol-3-phosphate glycosyltransferase
MRIAMVSEHASPLAAVGGVDAGGQNVHVASLASALVARGHEVVVYTRRDSPTLPGRVRMASGVVVEHVSAGPPEPLAKDDLLPHMPELGRRLAAAWAEAPPDVVHAHFWMSGLAATAARDGLAAELPVVQTFHALGSVKRRHQGDRDTSPAERLRLEAQLACSVDRVVATCSDEVFELRKMGLPRRAATVVPCGVDVEHFSPTGEAWPGTSRPRIVSLGRLVERKGVDTLIEGLVDIPGAELVVAGGPATADLGDDPEASRLRHLAERLGVADRVVLVGQVSRQSAPALLRSADVVACLPWYEPFGIVPLEAMACGRPVIASAVGGLVDTVVEGVTGVLVPPQRPDLFAAATRDLLGSPQELARLGAAARERATTRYTWDRVAHDTEDVYQQLVRHPRGALSGVGR